MGRAAFATFTPSRLYPKAFKYTTEDAAFWGIIGANVLAALACKAEAPWAREFVMRHMRTSVEALVDGRYHTLVTCVVSHYSLIHMAINLAMLAVFRRTQPLAAGKLLELYALGGVAGAAGHAAYCWWDAGGLRFGTQYALNTPSFFGCSGGVAAVTAYKAVLEPAALRMVGGIIPLPILFALPLYCAMEVKEAEYCDGYPAKLSGAAVGAAMAILTLLTRGRARPAGPG